MLFGSQRAHRHRGTIVHRSTIDTSLVCQHAPSTPASHRAKCNLRPYLEDLHSMHSRCIPVFPVCCRAAPPVWGTHLEDFFGFFLIGRIGDSSCRPVVGRECTLCETLPSHYYPLHSQLYLSQELEALQPSSMKRLPSGRGTTAVTDDHDDVASVAGDAAVVDAAS